MVKPNYGVEQIKTLEGIEAIRLRPGMYIGSTGPDGVRHITLEIISNAVDEYLNGYCSEARIEVAADDTVTITDNGRGVPFGKAEDGSETLENIFTKLHTGAKFDSSGKTFTLGDSGNKPEGFLISLFSGEQPLINIQTVINKNKTISKRCIV